MKWIMVMGAVLALSPVAFGAASFTLTESGGSATAIEAEAGTTISLDFQLTGEGTADVVSFGLEASSTGIFDVSGQTWATALGAVQVEPKFLSIPGLDTKSYDGGGMAATGKAFPAGPSVLETIDLDIAAGATLNQTYTITLVNPLPSGMLLVQYTDTGLGENSDGYDYGAGLTLGSYEVTIVPEPASMLLLVGALPFLRRRRAA